MEIKQILRSGKNVVNSYIQKQFNCSHGRVKNLIAQCEEELKPKKNKKVKTTIPLFFFLQLL